MIVFGKDYSPLDIRKHVGDISQLCGARRVRLQGGPEDGVEVVEVRTGSGLCFDIIPSRGMDIGRAEYRGIPLAWRSPTGEVAPQFFEPEGFGWLRGFYGGLVTTCGLTYMGAPCEDEGQKLGLHGRASYTPARDVNVECGWQEERYVITVRGRITETTVFGEFLTLTRTIETELGGNSIRITDRVENMGFKETEHMILYHVNLGFPVMAEGSELLVNSASVEPRDEDAARGAEFYNRMDPPTPLYREKVYYHTVIPDADGYGRCALINRQLAGGFGVYVKYSASTLPCLNQWKMCGEGTYVTGIEPANARVGGRALAREDGSLRFISPGERIDYEVEIGVLATPEELKDYEERQR